MQQNKKLWFRRKRYGWGWFPISLEGWLSILVYVVILAYLIVGVDKNSPNDVVTIFLIKVAVLSAILIGVCYWKGESPKWSWAGK